MAGTPMKSRKLKVAWSVGGGIICVLLIMLWVRSYFRHDALICLVVDGKEVGVISDRSRLNFLAEETPNAKRAITTPGLRFTTRPAAATPSPEPYFDFGSAASPQLHLRWLLIPHWFVATMVAVIAFLPWLRWRFSLRSLLIATTLFALALGVIVWLAHQ